MAGVNLGSAYGRIDIDSSGALGAIGQVSKGLLGLGGGGGAFGIAAAGALGLGAALTAGVAIPAAGAALGLGSFISSSVGLASELEAQLDGVQAVMGNTNEDIANLKTLITDLGVDPKLKVSSLEAAAAIEMLGRNGLDTQEILDGAARSTVLLSNATGGEFAQSADIMTDAMALFKIEAADTIGAVDGITSVVTNSKFSINDYALALAQGGGVAAVSGVEFADFNTTIAGIAPLFASGSDAGTSFKVFLQSLVGKSGPAKDAMMELGLITEDGANQFFTATGEMKSMTEISSILGDALAGLSEEEKNAALSTIFGTDAMRAAAGIAELGRDSTEGYANAFEELQAAMSETDATAAAATRMDNLAGSIEILQGIIETLKIRVGDEFIPIVKDGVDRLAGFLSDNQDNIVQFFAAIADWIGAMGERAGPVLDELIPALGELGRIFLGIGADIYDTTEGIELFLLALGFSPETVSSITEVLLSIETGLQTFTANLPGYIASVSEFVSGLLTTFQEGGFAGLAEYVWSWVAGAQESGPEMMTGLINFISNFLLEQWPAISAALATWKDKFFDWVMGEGGVISRVGEVLSGFAAAMLLWSQDPATQATMSQIGLGLADGLIGALQTLSEDQARIGLITAALFTMMGAVGVLALETFMNVGQSLAGGFISGIVAWVTGGEPSTQLSTVIGEMWNGVMQTIISTIMPAAAVAFAVGQFNEIRTEIGAVDWLGIGTSMIDGMIEGVTGGAGRLATAVYDAAQAAWDAATDFWEIGSPSRRMAGMYENVMMGGVQGIEAGSGSLVDASMAAAVAAGDAAALQAPSGGGASPTQIAEALAGLGGGETQLTVNFSGGNGGPANETEAENSAFLISNAMKRRGLVPG